MNVAIMFPGSTFPSDWVFEYGKLLGYCWAKRIGTILCPAQSNSTHISRGYALMCAEGNGTPYDYAFSIDSDQLEGMAAFQELLLTMESRPDIDILAAWSCRQGSEGVKCAINAGNLLKDDSGKFVVKDGVLTFDNMSIEEIEDNTEPIEKDWVGFGCVMIRRKVFHGMDGDLFSPVYNCNGNCIWVPDDLGFWRTGKGKRI